LLAGLLLGLGTTHWRYATALFHHAPSTLMVTLAYLCALKRSPRFGSAGALAGVAVTVDYSNAIFAPWLILLALSTRRGALRNGARFLAGFVPPVAVLATYQWLCFGSPVATTYSYQYRFQWSTGVRSALAEVWWRQLSKVLWRPPGGLLVLSPFLIMAPAGWLHVARRNWRHGLSLAGAFVSLLVAVSSHRTPFGGGTIDARYLSAALPLAVVPAGMSIARALRWREDSPPRPVALLVLSILIGFSVLAQVAAVSTFFGHELHEPPTELLSERLGGTADATAWPVIGRLLLAALLPGLGRLPAASALAGVCLAGVVVGMRTRRRLAHRRGGSTQTRGTYTT
jgi:hypothetical protein